MIKISSFGKNRSNGLFNLHSGFFREVLGTIHASKNLQDLGFAICAATIWSRSPT